jgi:hypothetical protein
VGSDRSGRRRILIRRAASTERPKNQLILLFDLADTISSVQCTV